MSSVWGPCLTSVEQGCNYDGTIHVDFRAQAHTTFIPEALGWSAERSTCLSKTCKDDIINHCIFGQRTFQICEFIHDIQGDVVNSNIWWYMVGAPLILRDVTVSLRPSGLRLERAVLNRVFTQFIGPDRAWVYISWVWAEKNKHCGIGLGLPSLPPAPLLPPSVPPTAPPSNGGGRCCWQCIRQQ